MTRLRGSIWRHRAMALLALASACTSEPREREADHVTEVAAEGAWTVAARRGRHAILIELPSRGSGAEQRRDARGAEPAPPAALVFTPGEPLQPATIELLPLILPGVPPERVRRLAVGRLRLEGTAVYFSIPGWAPPLLPSPADPNLYLFAEANALWTFTDPATVRRLTSVRVGAFDFAELAAKQREGIVILYWADGPVWSPDGKQIAYITNREAVHGDSSGQSIWLLELQTGRERPLLAQTGESFYPTGWLGRELTFGGPPGILAVDPVTRARREVASAATIASAPDGSALAIAENAPHATSIRVLSPTRSETVPPPPPGSTYAPQAVFSPGADRLLLLATADNGSRRNFFVFHRSSGRLSPVRTPAGQLFDWPAWLDDDHLLVNGQSDQV